MKVSSLNFNDHLDLEPIELGLKTLEHLFCAIFCLGDVRSG